MIGNSGERAEMEPLIMSLRMSRNGANKVPMRM